MKRVLCLLLTIILLIGTVSSGFAAAPATPFDADEEINIKMTGAPPEPAATIAFNAAGAYTNNGINYDFDLVVPYDVDPLVITIRGYGTSSVDYELNGADYTGTPEPVKTVEIPRSTGDGDIDLDIKWFPDSDSSQEVMHGTINFVFLPEPPPEDVTLTMAVDGQGSTDPEVGDHVVSHGSVVDVTAYPDTGWEFIRWDGPVASSGSIATSVLMTTDATVTAIFEPIDYTLTVTHEGDGTTDPDGASTVHYGDIVPLEADPDQGWKFVRWDGPVASSGQAATTVEIFDNTDVHAVFREKPTSGMVLLEVIVDGGGSTVPTEGSHQYPVGTTVPLIATADPCWEFVEWILPGATTASATTEILLTTDATVTAIFHIDPQCLFTVDTDEAPPEGGTTSGGIVNALFGTPFTVEAMANPDWDFDGWSTDGSTIFTAVNPYGGYVTGDETYTAHFSTPGNVYYTLDIDSFGPGYTVPSEGSYQYASGAIVHLEAIPDGPADYFDGWTGTDGSAVYYDDGYKILMDGDKSIIAEFDSEMDRLELIVRIDGSGEVEVSSGASTSVLVTSIKTFYVPSGATVYMIPDADSGHYFDEWNGPDQNDVESEGSGEYSIFMDEDKDITAEFNKRSSPPPIVIRYRLKITVEGSGTVDPFVGSQTYNPGDLVDVSADPSDGWAFDGWIGPDGEDVISGQIEMDENKHITAKFVQEVTPPPIEPPEIEIPLIEAPLGEGDLPDTGYALPWLNLILGFCVVTFGYFFKKETE